MATIYWTKENTEKLVELTKTSTRRMTASSLNGSIGAVDRKAYEMGLKFIHKERTNWSNQEYDILRKLVNERKTHEEISKIMGRATSSIDGKCSDLKIRTKINEPPYSPNEENQLKDLFFNKNMSLKNIAITMNRTYEKTAKMAIKLGIRTDKSLFIEECKKLKSQGKRRCIICDKILTDDKFYQNNRNRHCIECYTEKNPEYYNKSKQSWTIETIINKRVYQAKRRSKMKNIPFEITNLDVIDLYKKQEGKCHYSGIQMNIIPIKNNWNNLSIDRVDSSKGYTNDNIVLCCDSINTMKNQMGRDEFFEKIKQIYPHNKL